MLFIWGILWLMIISKSSQATAKKSFPKLSPHHDITVTLSERKPFVILNENGQPQGLDTLIIENFAHKFNLKIKYFVVNTSLNYIFSNENNFNAFPDQASLRSDYNCHSWHDKRKESNISFCNF